MKKPLIRASGLASPKQQHNWDWRAASNFIAGGAGGGLLLCAALAGLDALPTRAAILLGLILIGSGLTCVWFEIGRPWRAMNVYRHFSSSWMTREAVVALAVFASGGLAVLTGAAPLVVLSGILGLGFVYSQARILAANKGIPAWRHPASVPLMVATGLAEGAGFLACVASFTGAGSGSVILLGLLVLIAARAWFWMNYLNGLTAGGAPDAALRVLAVLSPRLLLVGHGLPALAALAALADVPGRSVLALAAGALAVAGGWLLKFTLVRRAAYTQGLALQHQPVRGRGPSGPAARPGWKIIGQASKL
jgi:phenylacetyl-CoA:acceptor oxidoreductase subunit 2